jgi:lysozyme
VTDTFDLAILTEELTQDEGTRAFPYTDTKGHLSIGIGHNLSAKGITAAAIDFLFAGDVDDCCAVMDRNIDWWRALPMSKQRVMINLVFNMGWASFSQFHHFLAAMEAEDWPTAAAQLKDSVWFHQVGDRGPRVIGRLLATDVEPSSALSEADILNQQQLDKAAP